MIYYLVTKGGRSGIVNYLASWGRPLADRMNLILFDDLPRLQSLPVGTYIFSNFDRLSPAQRDIVNQIYMQLSQVRPRLMLLNSPSHVLLRYELLRKLHASGINRFQVIRAADSWDSLHFPVFLRGENIHYGALTRLLHTRKELERAIAAKIILGYSLHNLLVVEFCDTSDEKGIFRKYSAFMVAGKIIPRYLSFSRHWVVKFDPNDKEEMPEVLTYLDQNPHETWLREVFNLAQIDYGRIDYSMLGNEPQVWEINLNPLFGRGRWKSRQNSCPSDYMPLLHATKEKFHNRFLSALKEIDNSHDGRQEIPITLPIKKLRSLKPKKRQQLLDLFHRFLGVKRSPYYQMRRSIEQIVSLIAFFIHHFFKLGKARKPQK